MTTRKGGDTREEAQDAQEAEAVTHVVMFSGGIGSWAAAKRVAAQHGTANLVLLFTDTKGEDEDTYRFLHEAAANVGAPLVIIADGRTIWEVFRDHKFLGNSGAAMCSRILKRELADTWIAEHYTPETAIGYVGIDWSEIERFEGDSDEVIAAKALTSTKPRLGLRRLKAQMGWTFEAPMCEPPYLTKREQHEWAEREGLRKQRLYVMGAAHANCGGGCVKMGHGGFARLFKAWPERFAEWEANEAALRQQLGDVSILRARKSIGGETVTTPLPLSTLREQIQASRQIDLLDIGGCGCFVDEPEPEAA